MNRGSSLKNEDNKELKSNQIIIYAFVVIFSLIVIDHILFSWMYGNAEHTIQIIKEHKNVELSAQFTTFSILWIISLIIYVIYVTQDKNFRN